MVIKRAADLTQEQRADIPKKMFALTGKQSTTGKPAYPIHDERHARLALAYVRMHGSPEQQSEVFKDVATRYPQLAARSSIPAVREQAKHASRATELAGLGMLAAIPLDELQAKYRARKAGVAPEKKSLLGGSTGHALLDVAGLGTLAAPYLMKTHP